MTGLAFGAPDLPPTWASTRKQPLARLVHRGGRHLDRNLLPQHRLPESA